MFGELHLHLVFNSISSLCCVHCSHLGDSSIASHHQVMRVAQIEHLPDSLSMWRLCASAGSFHRIHCDSGGMATYVKIARGMKFWWVATGFASNKSVPVDGWELLKHWNESNSNKPLELMSKFTWELIVLNEGSCL